MVINSDFHVAIPNSKRQCSAYFCRERRKIKVVVPEEQQISPFTLEALIALGISIETEDSFEPGALVSSNALIPQNASTAAEGSFAVLGEQHPSLVTLQASEYPRAPISLEVLPPPVPIATAPLLVAPVNLQDTCACKYSFCGPILKPTRSFYRSPGRTLGRCTFWSWTHNFRQR